MNPYRRPDLDPKAEAVLREAEELQAQLRKLDGDRRVLARSRDAAVVAAVRYGASRRRIAERLEISPEAVRQIVGGD